MSRPSLSVRIVQAVVCSAFIAVAYAVLFKLGCGVQLRVVAALIIGIFVYSAIECASGWVEDLLIATLVIAPFALAIILAAQRFLP